MKTKNLIVLCTLCFSFLSIIFLVSCTTDDSMTEPENNAPTVTITAEGESGDIIIDHDVFLFSSASDPDGDPITSYLWEFVSTPSGSAASISNSTFDQAAFRPDVAGDYVVKLTVSDGELTGEAQITITVGLPELIAQLIITASTGGDSNAPTGSVVILETNHYLNTPDGQTPVGPTGDPLTFTFEFVSLPAGSASVFTDPAAGEAGQKVFTMDKPGSYEVRVTITDGTQTATDTRTIATFAPQDITFQPIFGKPGETIEVFGSYMSPTAIDNVVTINGIAAIVTATSGLPNPTLTVEVPTGVTTGTISVTLGTDEAVSTNKFYAYPNVTVSTLAGSTMGNTDATGTSAQFNSPFGITYYSTGDKFYITDSGNNTVREVSSTGVVTTLAGEGTGAYLDGPVASAQFFGPQGIVVNSSDVIYVADNDNNRIRRINSTHTSVFTLAGDGTNADLDGTGTAAQFSYGMFDMIIDNSSNIFLSSADTHVIRKIDGAGEVTTFAGVSGASNVTDGAGSAARFNVPTGLAIDSENNVYVAGSTTLRKITSGGEVTTLKNSLGFSDGTGSTGQVNSPTGLIIDDANGILYIADFGNNAIRQYIIEVDLLLTIAGTGSAGSTDGDGATAAFDGPLDITMDGSGNLYVTDYNNHKIRKISFQ